MSNHKIVFLGLADRMQARCSCKQKSLIGDRGFVEAWVYSHLQEIERVRAHLGPRSPSLKSQRDWFLAQADNTDNPPEDRALWQQLATELDHYVTLKNQPVLSQDALF